MIDGMTFKRQVWADSCDRLTQTAIIINAYLSVPRGDSTNPPSTRQSETYPLAFEL